MANDYYNVSGAPATQSTGASAVMRSEFADIAAGFSLLPTLSGNANGAVVINGAGSALTTTGPLALAGELTTTGAFNTTLVQGASVSLTLPVVSGTLATLAGTETLTNKTITAPVLSGSVTGTYTLAGTPTITGASLTGTTTLSGGVTATGQTVTGGTFAGVTLSGATTLPGSGQISSAGLLGIGMVPANVLDITQTQNSVSEARILNGSAGTAAQVAWVLNNNAGQPTVLALTGGSYAPTANYDVQNSTYLASNGAGGLSLAAINGTGAVRFYAGGTAEVARFDTSGRLLVGFTADQGGGQKVQVNGTVYTSGVTVSIPTGFSVLNGATTMMFSNANIGAGTPYASSVSVLSVRGDAITNRSISAGGTINASGADYAEYETKSVGAGKISSGQIVGFDADGQLTDKFSLAVSFGVKSTNPAYVGGDTWSMADDIAQDHKSARASVDRVAYSGKVPCNVTGAQVGDYIVPIDDGSDGISGKPTKISVMSIAQYGLAVGQVRKILADGRAEIAVKVG